MSRAESYERLFTEYGRRVTLKRQIPNGQPIEVENVRARIRGASQDEIAGGVQASERRILILAADVPTTMLPLLANDAVLVDGLTLRFTSRPDDQSHRDGEILLAIDGIASGA